MWVLFWRRAPEIPHLIAFTWVCCYGNGGGRGLSVPLVSGSAAAVRSSVTSSLESAPPSHFTTQLLETRCASAPLPSPRSEPDRSCLLQCVFLWNQARLDLSRDSHLSCVFFFFFPQPNSAVLSGETQKHFGGLCCEHGEKMAGTKRYWGLSLQLTHVQWGCPGFGFSLLSHRAVREKPGKSVKHKELPTAERPSFLPASPVLTGRRRLRSFCPTLPTATQSWTVRRSFQPVAAPRLLCNECAFHPQPTEDRAEFECVFLLQCLDHSVKPAERNCPLQCGLVCGQGAHSRAASATRFFI